MAHNGLRVGTIYRNLYAGFGYETPVHPQFRGGETIGVPYSAVGRSPAYLVVVFQPYRPSSTCRYP